MIFIAEYSNIIFLRRLTGVLFLGGGNFLASGYYGFLVRGLIRSFMGFVIVFLVVLCRRRFPRYRYDLLMKLIWCQILPILIRCFGIFLLLV